MKEAAVWRDFCHFSTEQKNGNAVLEVSVGTQIPSTWHCFTRFEFHKFCYFYRFLHFRIHSLVDNGANMILVPVSYTFSIFVLCLSVCVVATPFSIHLRACSSCTKYFNFHRMKLYLRFCFFRFVLSHTETGFLFHETRTPPKWTRARWILHDVTVQIREIFAWKIVEKA